MFTPEMLESIKKVEATRADRIGVEPKRMTAEEKETLLSKFHPDYKTAVSYTHLDVYKRQRGFIRIR